ncbi:unnamed protein product [Cladocopium goreaui]|uniref:Uncharacterized protein n=1 Tax=Cladocopium goreaui TaxID=2562237 RepID=A0A9P1DGT7_9DINO|nr:unnamed protein product [Cladocopium goreaui]
MELLGSPGWSWLDFWEHASKEDWAAHHPVLSLDEEQRCKAVAVTLHGDEGESKRSKNVLILSWSSIGIHGPSLKTKFPFCVIKSDLFVTQEKKNLTMLELQKAFVRMMNDCSRSTVDGYSLWYVCGKGDWKHKKDWLCEKRYWSTQGSHSAGMCRRCFCTGASYMDVFHQPGWHQPGEDPVESSFDPIPCLG